MKTVDYQFGGPYVSLLLFSLLLLLPLVDANPSLTRIGAFAITVGTPALAYTLYFACNESGCPSKAFRDSPLDALVAQWPGPEGLFSTQVFRYYCAWFFGLVALQFVLPGKRAQGVVLPDKSRLTYKLNGMTPFRPSVGPRCSLQQCWKPS